MEETGWNLWVMHGCLHIKHSLLNGSWAEDMNNHIHKCPSLQSVKRRFIYCYPGMEAGILKVRQFSFSLDVYM